MPRNDGPGWHGEGIVPRWVELQADIAQEQELARLEGRRIGHARAQAQMVERIRAEKRWFAVTATRWVPREVMEDDDDDGR
jgi:hypothetical protein